jgi:hypothetical protein
VVYCVQADLAFQNASRRNQISSNIQTRLAQNVPWGEVVRQDYTNAAGQPAVALEVRFMTRAEQESFWNDALAAVGSGVNGPVTGSAIYRHDCPHDEAQPTPCVVAEQVNW